MYTNVSPSLYFNSSNHWATSVTCSALSNLSKKSPVLAPIWNQYKTSALPIRGTDYQQTFSIDSITEYINSDSFKIDIDNPWANYIANTGPSHSASLLAFGAKYPILWYVFADVDPFYVESAPDPDSGHRSQGAFTLNAYQFLGASLFDGDSNDDITGTVSIPMLSNVNGNRGTNISGFSSQAAFSSISGYTAPKTNNTNKTFNPTFVGSNNGQPVREKDRNTIMKNISSIKGKIWTKLLSSGESDTVVKAYLDNWGSGFEIEAYVFPKNYDKDGSIWLDGTARNQQMKNSRFHLSDFYSLNIATDSKNYIDWTADHDEAAIESGYLKIYNDSITDGKQWVNKVTSSIKVPLTLITSVMLPRVNLTTPGPDTSGDFMDYVSGGYGPLGLPNFHHLGWLCATPTTVTVELFDQPIMLV